MLCMICKSIVKENLESCPICEANSWRMPEQFLNEDQHRIWLATVYAPQVKKWELIQQERKTHSEGEAKKSTVLNESEIKQWIELGDGLKTFITHNCTDGNIFKEFKKKTKCCNKKKKH